MAIPNKTEVKTLDLAYIRSGAFACIPAKSSISTTTMDNAYLRNGAWTGNPEQNNTTTRVYATIF